MFKFKPSVPLTIGLELELQLLNSKSLNLTNKILSIMELFPDSESVIPEFIQNTVELRSKICTDIEELRLNLISIVKDLRSKSKDLGIKLCGSGTHPFSRHLGILTPLPRYLELEETAGLISHTQITFATHVHIGMTTGDEAISVMRKLSAFIPFLISLSANSPFWRGYNTGFASYRHRILDSSRSYGLPPLFDNWQDFETFFKTAKRSGVFQSINDIHWDIRPRPHLGTLEIRVMDAQSSVTDAVTLANLIRLLVKYLIDTPDQAIQANLPHELPWWIAKENRFQASRLAIDSKFIKDETGSYRTINKVFQDVYKNIKPYVEDSNEALYLQKL
nr:YbdK family carboxylate-amine ligase [Candidatus Dadabacteria bacterium]